mgnify:CR=1 FL=1
MVLTASNAVESVSNSGRIENIIVGIATGIVSSILVTLWFRYVDSRREAKTYFYEISKYVRMMSKAFSINQLDQKEQVYAIFDFIKDEEEPHCYWWTFLSRKEKELKEEFDNSCANLFFQASFLVECHRAILEGDESEELLECKKKSEDAFKEEWEKLIDCQGNVLRYVSGKLYK